MSKTKKTTEIRLGEEILWSYSPYFPLLTPTKLAVGLGSRADPLTLPRQKRGFAPKNYADEVRLPGWAILHLVPPPPPKGGIRRPIRCVCIHTNFVALLYEPHKFLSIVFWGFF